jgi:ribosomal-protein-alanine N-acetyltransferase
MHIETPRLQLQLITPQKINELFKSKSKSEIISFFEFSEAGYERLALMNEGGMETHNLSVLFFVLIDKKQNVSIGECGFHTWNKTHRRAELFYSMHHEEFKQRGLMKEALAYVLNYGFTEMYLHRIAALIAKENLASYKLLKHSGFSFEGTMREDYVVNGINEDSDCYSLLEHEWKKKENI